MSTERDELAHLIERAGQFGPSTVECLRSQDAEYYAEAILAAGYRKIFDGDCGLSNAAPDERDAAEAWMRWANILTIGPDEERNGIAAMRQMLTEFGYRKPRTITTVEELDALSNGSSVLCLDAEGEGHPAQKHADGWGLPFSSEFWTAQQILDGCESITIIQEWAS